MRELISSYSLKEILICIIAIALAIKGGVSFWDWAVARIKLAFNKEYDNRTDKQKLEQKIKENGEVLAELRENYQELTESIATLAKRMDILIDSDKDSIKSYVTEKHHFFCYEQKWIDDYSLECCERRFSHYEDEGGNSYVVDLMKDLRKLPKVPPQE